MNRIDKALEIVHIIRCLGADDEIEGSVGNRLLLIDLDRGNGRDLCKRGCQCAAQFTRDVTDQQGAATFQLHEADAVRDFLRHGFENEPRRVCRLLGTDHSLPAKTAPGG